MNEYSEDFLVNKPFRFVHINTYYNLHSINKFEFERYRYFLAYVKFTMVHCEHFSKHKVYDANRIEN